MAPLDSIGQGLGEAFKDPPVWVALITAIGAVLTTVGAKKAGDSLQSWASKRGAPKRTSRDNEILNVLREIRDSMRDMEHALQEQAATAREIARTEGRMTRTAVHEEARATQEQLQRVAETLAVLLELDRARRAGN